MTITLGLIIGVSATLLGNAIQNIILRILEKFSIHIENKKFDIKQLKKVALVIINGYILFILSAAMVYLFSTPSQEFLYAIFIVFVSLFGYLSFFSILRDIGDSYADILSFSSAYTVLSMIFIYALLGVLVLLTEIF